MNAFVKTNGSVNAREIRKPKKNRSRVFFKQKVFLFFFRKPVNTTGTVAAVPRRGSLRRGLRRARLGGGGAGLGGGGSGGEGGARARLPATGGEAKRRAAAGLDAAAASPAAVMAKTERGGIYGEGGARGLGKGSGSGGVRAADSGGASACGRRKATGQAGLALAGPRPSRASAYFFL